LLHQFLVCPGTDHNDHANFALRQIGELGELAVIKAIREAVFNCGIAAFDIANVSKATAH
jgi:hypothetical protein